MSLEQPATAIPVWVGEVAIGMPAGEVIGAVIAPDGAFSRAAWVMAIAGVRIGDVAVNAWGLLVVAGQEFDEVHGISPDGVHPSC